MYRERERYMYLIKYLCMYACMYVCVYIYMYIYIYIYGLRWPPRHTTRGASV